MAVSSSNFRQVTIKIYAFIRKLLHIARMHNVLCVCSARIQLTVEDDDHFLFSARLCMEVAHGIWLSMLCMRSRNT